MTKLDRIRMLVRKFPDIHHAIWKGNVLHGRRLQGCAGSYSRMPSDCSDACLELVRLGMLQPIAFRPDHSEAAFLGLDGCKSGDTPTARDAHAWDFEVLSDWPQG